MSLYKAYEDQPNRRVERMKKMSERYKKKDSPVAVEISQDYQHIPPPPEIFEVIKQFSPTMDIVEVPLNNHVHVNHSGHYNLPSIPSESNYTTTLHSKLLKSAFYYSKRSYVTIMNIVRKSRRRNGSIAVDIPKQPSLFDKLHRILYSLRCGRIKKPLKILSSTATTVAARERMKKCKRIDPDVENDEDAYNVLFIKENEKIWLKCHRNAQISDLKVQISKYSAVQRNDTVLLFIHDSKIMNDYASLQDQNVTNFSTIYVMLINYYSFWESTIGDNKFRHATEDSNEMEYFQVFAKYQLKSDTFNVFSNMSVSVLKSQIYAKCKIDAKSDISLSFHGQILDDYQTLDFYGVGKDCTIHVNSILIGGGIHDTAEESDNKKSGKLIASTKENFENFNLNQSKHRCNDHSVYGFSSKNGFKNNSYAADDCLPKRKSWNKSTKDLCFKIKPNLREKTDEENGNQNQWKKKAPLKRSSSTLSLHIAAYEKSIETQNENSILPAESIALKTGSTVSQLQSHHSQNSFEFPRQADDKENNEPEIIQFKASQRLLNPNESCQLSGRAPELEKTRDDFLQQAFNRIGATKNNATTPSRNTGSSSATSSTPTRKHPSSSRLPYYDLDKKPKIDIRPINDQVSTILEKAKPLDPLVIENIRLQNDNKEKDDEIKKLQQELREARKTINLREKPSNYAECGDRRQQIIIQNEYDRIQSKYNDAAPQIISQLHNRFGGKDVPMFSPALTGHIFHTAGISLNKARKLRHEFYVHGAPSFLASERKVNEEKKRIRAGVDFEEINVQLKVKNEKEIKVVTFMKDPGAYAQRRLQQISDNGLYRKIEYKGKEELWWALTIDKAADRTVLGMICGNTTKAINSRYNFTVLGIFEADDSSLNIHVAFEKIFGILGNIKEITIRTLAGNTVTLPVRWFYIADYKSEKGVAGIKSGNPNYPSIKCLSTMKETYGEIDLQKKCPPRPTGCHEKLSQERPSLAPFIPPSHFIPPPLHMTLGPGAALFDYLFEVVAKIDSEKGKAEEVYLMLESNRKWNKQLRASYSEIVTLQNELKDIQETAELYEALLSSNKNERKLKPCSLNSECVVKLLKKNIPSHFISSCNTCSKSVHRCCKAEDLTCPHCTPFTPTTESGRKHLSEEEYLITVRVGEIICTLTDKEASLQQEVQKITPGPFTKTLEKVLEKHGGSRKAFFQAYSGAHLIKMGNNLNEIVQDLPAEIKEDERIVVVLEAMRLFFAAKKSMKKDLGMSDHDINDMKQKIWNFGTYMKEHLGTLKPKQKGHLFLFEALEFAEEFRTSAYFSDEAVESVHPLLNEQEKRIKFKESPKRYGILMKWAIDQNFYYDNVECASDFEKKVI